MSAKILTTQLEFTFYSAQRNLEGVDHFASLRAPVEGTSTINWILGHVINTRNVMLETLGAAHGFDERGQTMYGRGTKPGGDCLTLEELRGFHATTQKTLMDALAKVDDAFLAEEVPGIFEPEEKVTRAEKLATLVFHEAYHMGQIGLIRHALGFEPAIT